MTRRYAVIRDCFFQRLWHKGDIAEFEDNIEVPRHFKECKSEAGLLAARSAGNRPRNVLYEQPQQETAAERLEEQQTTESLEDMTITKLRSYAKSYGIEVEKGATKEEIIAAIRGE